MKNKIVRYSDILRARNKATTEVFNYKNTKAYDYTLTPNNIDTYLRSGVWYNTLSETENVINLLAEATDVIEANPLCEQRMIKSIETFLTKTPIVKDWNTIYDNIDEDCEIHDQLLNYVNIMNEASNDIFAYDIANKELNFEENLNLVLNSRYKNTITYVKTIYDLLKDFSLLEIPDEKQHMYFYRLLEVYFDIKHLADNQIKKQISNYANLFFYINGNLNLDLVKEYNSSMPDNVEEYSLIMVDDNPLYYFNSKEDFEFLGRIYQDNYKDSRFINIFKQAYRVLKNHQVYLIDNRVIREYIAPNIIYPEIDDVVADICDIIDERNMKSSNSSNEIDLISKIEQGVLDKKVNPNDINKILDLDFRNYGFGTFIAKMINSNLESKDISMINYKLKYNSLDAGSIKVSKALVSTLFAMIAVMTESSIRISILDIAIDNIHSLDSTYYDRDKFELIVDMVNTIEKYKTSEETYNEENILINSAIDKLKIQLCRIKNEYKWNYSGDCKKDLMDNESLLLLNSFVNNITAETNDFIESLIRLILSSDFSNSKSSTMLLNNIHLTMYGKDWRTMDNILKHINFTNAIIAYILKVDELDRFSTAIYHLIKDINRKLEPCIHNIAGHDMEEIVEDLLKIKIIIKDYSGDKYTNIFEEINYTIRYLKEEYNVRYNKPMSIFLIVNRILYNEIIDYLAECNYDQYTISQITKKFPFTNNVILDSGYDLYNEFLENPTEETLDIIINSGTVFQPTFCRIVDLLAIFIALTINPNTTISGHRSEILKVIFNTFITELNSAYIYSSDELMKLKYVYICIVRIISKNISISKGSEDVLQDFIDTITKILNENSDIIAITEDVDDPFDNEYYKFDVDKKKKDSNKDEDDTEDESNDDDDDEDDEDDDDFDDDSDDDDDDDDDFDDNDSDDDDDDWEVYNEDPKKANESFDLLRDEELVKAYVYSDLLIREAEYMDKGLIKFFSLSPLEQRKYGIGLNINEYTTPDIELGHMVKAFIDNKDAISVYEAKEEIKKDNKKKIKNSMKSGKEKISKVADVAKTKTVNALDKTGKVVGKGVDKTGKVVGKGVNVVDKGAHVVAGGVKQFNADVLIMRNKIKDVANKAHKVDKKLSQEMDTVFDRSFRNIKQDMANKNRQAILKGKVLPSLSSMIKLVTTSTAATLLGQPILGLITLVGGIGLSVNANKEQRELILDEIDVQLKVIDKRIADAESNGDHEVYETLLRIKKRLQKEQAKIQYKSKKAQKIATTNSLQGKDD